MLITPFNGTRSNIVTINDLPMYLKKNQDVNFSGANSKMSSFQEHVPGIKFSTARTFQERGPVCSKRCQLFKFSFACSTIQEVNCFQDHDVKMSTFHVSFDIACSA